MNFTTIESIFVVVIVFVAVGLALWFAHKENGQLIEAQRKQIKDLMEQVNQSNIQYADKLSEFTNECIKLFNSLSKMSQSSSLLGVPKEKLTTRKSTAKKEKKAPEKEE